MNKLKKTMKKVFVIAALAVCFSFATNAQDTDPVILWKNNLALRWDDFEGKPTGEHQQNAAMTFSNINIDLSKEGEKIVCEVECTFSKNKSWVKPGKESPHLLAHEQRHFDLGEVYARKIREAISKLKFTDVKEFQQDVAETYNSLLNEYRMQQELYDSETNHGLQKEQQEKWNKKIKAQLEDLKDFSELKVYVDMS